MATKVKVNESVRRIISTTADEAKLHNVKSVDISGSWIRLQADEGYALVNPNNVLMMIVKGDQVF